MSRVALYMPLALLFLANVIPSKAQTETEPSAAATEPALPLVLYDVRGNMTLLCPLPNDAASSDLVWRKNGTLLEEVWELKDRYKLTRAQFFIEQTVEDDFGNYSCALGTAQHTWAVRGRPYLKLPVNSNVVEGQTMKLVCKVVGKPYPTVTWTYSATGEGNYTSALEALGDRAHTADSDAGVPEGQLVFSQAARADAGHYRCSADLAPAPAETVLHVKDMYAALWPFLGICAEVLVLCVIILVYEKRRTKPELDDSDADNHDTKKS